MDLSLCGKTVSPCLLQPLRGCKRLDCSHHVGIWALMREDIVHPLSEEAGVQGDDAIMECCNLLKSFDERRGQIPRGIHAPRSHIANQTQDAHWLGIGRLNLHLQLVEEILASLDAADCEVL